MQSRSIGRLGIGSGCRQPCQLFGLGHQVIAGAPAAPLLPALQPCALGMQRLVAGVQRIARPDAVQGLQRGVDGLQMLLHDAELAVGERRLGLLHQVVQRQQLLRGGRPAHLRCERRRDRRGARGRVLALPLLEALVQPARQFAIGH